jgi:hypothetical protein
VLKDRFKFLDLWCKFLTVSILKLFSYFWFNFIDYFIGKS